MTESTTAAQRSHTLRVDKIDLLGAYRTVFLGPGMNIVRGDITTGKTTFVKLLRALLGSIPKNLAPETASIRAIAADVVLGDDQWQVLRPMVTTKETPVELAEMSEEDGEGLALRLPAAGTGSYGEFLLRRLGIPVVFVPKARTDPASDLSPVTINDWLNYCIVPGEELDAQVFGHRDVFRNNKRRWVFEILYGLYDKDLAALNAEARRLDREIAATESEREVVGRFLKAAEVGDRFTLEAQLEHEIQRKDALTARKSALTSNANDDPAGEVAALRTMVLDRRRAVDEANAQVRNLDGQIRDLVDLGRELNSLSKRLTRSIVADEWMVDFDFMVCPRCGNDIDQHRAETPICYLCEQPEPDSAPDRDQLIKEQDRITYQIAETEQLLAERRATRNDTKTFADDLSAELKYASTQLDAVTANFVSSNADEIRAVAAEEAAADANFDWVSRMLKLLTHYEDHDARLAALHDRLEALQEDIAGHQSSLAAGEENIEALEKRMLEYLEQLNVPILNDLLTVRLNRTDYLPEVSTRSFDELSSQGLKTLVNVAHALAHHTVAIDRGLPLPGFLVLDGVSANSGKEGLDGDRILDMYQLFVDVADTYQGKLQLVIVDNEVPEQTLVDERVVDALTLTQADRLIRSSWPGSATTMSGG